MTLRIESESAPGCLKAYGSISIAFTVTERLDLNHLYDERGRATLCVLSVEPPFNKDYDAIAGNRPSDWANRRDVSDWLVISAFEDGERVGGLVLILDSPAGSATLWDIRVASKNRGRGTGAALLRFAEERARSRGLQRIEVETQDVNVGACRFYARQGFQMVSVVRDAYPECRGEVRLSWEKLLPPR